jgi:ribosomal protein L2
MDEWKGMITRNVRNRCETWIGEISLPAKNNGEKIKAEKNSHREAQPHHDDEQL